MSKKPKSVSTSTSGSAQTWAQPIAQAGASSVQNVFNQNQPGLQQLTDLTRNNIVNPLLGKFNSSLGTAGQANGYYGDVLSGKYMGGNPYLKNVLDTLNRGVGDQVNSQFEMSGRYGSGAHADVLSRNLADADSGLLYQNYGDEMNRMGQAAQAAQAGNNADIASLLSAIGAGAELPYTGSNNLANSLGALFNGGTSKSTQTGPSPIWGAIGAGLGAAGAAFSDIRLKTKVEKVGEFADGLCIYRFAYKSNPKQMFKGVMAHEVKKLRPWAYIENYRGSGFDGVNYGLLGSQGG
jgi:hypothetical protein